MRKYQDTMQKDKKIVIILQTKKNLQFTKGHDAPAIYQHITSFTTLRK